VAHCTKLKNESQKYMTAHPKGNVDPPWMSRKKLVKPRTARKRRIMQVFLAVMGIDIESHTKHNILQEGHD
jgi:hypothetical protein